jgi:hypothetical protein
MEQVRSIARGHVRRGWAGIGYHYLVGPSGTIYKVNSLNRVAAHAGKYNPQSIGIACMLRQGEPTIAQVNATAELIKVLDYDLKLHYDLINTGCPGSYLGPAVWKALDITPPPIEPPPNFTVEHTPAEGYGVKIIIGNYHTPGAEVQLRWEWGQLETVIAGSKDEYGPGGFEIYAGDDHSVHQIIVEGVQYEIPMVPGKSTLCRSDTIGCFQNCNIHSHGVIESFHFKTVHQQRTTWKFVYPIGNLSLSVDVEMIFSIVAVIAVVVGRVRKCEVIDVGTSFHIIEGGQDCMG